MMMHKGLDALILPLNLITDLATVYGQLNYCQWYSGLIVLPTGSTGKKTGTFLRFRSRRGKPLVIWTLRVDTS